MKQIILLRHSIRVDKEIRNVNNSDGSIDTSSWLSNFDPPLDIDKSIKQLNETFNDHVLELIGSKGGDIIIHSSPYNRCLQTAEIITEKFSGDDHDDHITRLRIDHSLSEWLNFNFNLRYLPPNDKGLSLMSNVNQYLYGGNSKLAELRDPYWNNYKFGDPGEYGESLNHFKKRCLNYLQQLLVHYEGMDNEDNDDDSTVIIISHGAVISVLLQIMLKRNIFSEIPLGTPIIFNKIDHLLFQILDYDSIHMDDDLFPQDGIYDLSHLTLPIGYESNILISSFTNNNISPLPSLTSSNSSCNTSSNSSSNGENPEILPKINSFELTNKLDSINDDVSSVSSSYNNERKYKNGNLDDDDSGSSPNDEDDEGLSFSFSKNFKIHNNAINRHRANTTGSSFIHNVDLSSDIVSSPTDINFNRHRPRKSIYLDNGLSLKDYFLNTRNNSNTNESDQNFKEYQSQTGDDNTLDSDGTITANDEDSINSSNNNNNNNNNNNYNKNNDNNNNNDFMLSFTSDSGKDSVTINKLHKNSNNSLKNILFNVSLDNISEVNEDDESNWFGFNNKV
ncbi:hypothetical protein PACTADRAFT_47744 [Pachysolen tannophilus NRRL Y-2460]|uniref:Uncharacterized protein n=1 Tax=Pachysolen tannophilus NRRL Y-2460 TaxID=669874 RepID=A0A1E4U1P9_PACTA|nr:hypothetical protein PACTADRAFT_47744 [Pachysolen tannophilus NRRL Y-2460]